MSYLVENLTAIVDRCQNSPVGKLLPNAFYVHTSAIASLDRVLQNYQKSAQKLTDEVAEATLVKFSLDKAKISYLFYPDFDRDPHPELHSSIIINLETNQVTHRYYYDSNNPPILHRKETFVTPDYPLYQEFAELTNFEKALGLLNNSRSIGTRREWDLRLLRLRISFEGHRLVCPIDLVCQEKPNVQIDRHKAAMVRREISRPVRIALEAGLIGKETTFFDYGCGYGGDVQRLSDRGITCSGWDPYYHPDTPLSKADIVNIGYVINVIENTAERREALIEAWSLTDRVLIVSAQVLIDDRNRGLIGYGDGIITNRNTFQKYYQQEELKIYIDRVLDVDSIPIGLGIYVVFRDQEQAESFRVSRFRSRVTTPKVTAKVRNFEEYRELLKPLMDFVVQRGRLPVVGELAEESEIKQEFRNFRQAFKLILQATNEKEWSAVSEKRRQDLQLYLALASFSSRPSIRRLSPQMKEDIKALFGSYRQACTAADLMLYSLSNLDNIGNLCLTSKVGKKVSNALLIHISILESLDPLLRLYEGCASRTIGRLEEANLIKFYYNKPKISYYFYPNFDTDPHPILDTVMTIDLRDLQVDYRDYYLEENPPILHKKEMLVDSNYPGYEKFAHLTQIEKDLGLLKNSAEISRLQGWLKCLQEHCLTFRGHQLFWSNNADSDKIKYLKSQLKLL